VPTKVDGAEVVKAVTEDDADSAKKADTESLILSENKNQLVNGGGKRVHSQSNMPQLNISRHEELQNEQLCMLSLRMR
jgi:hypothetical protein